MRLSGAAEADFDAIDAYSNEQFGDEVATAYMRGFGELFDLLRAHPHAGQDASELGKGVRSLMHRSHRVFYRLDKDVLHIVRILHHAQDARRQLRG